ncbi:uncharacterized protein LOC130674495 [Microplitis mediator]|uniref:uncharacterized protein LOC130674495 n=1 Tax=Microplitis mediator TaxID=375433 RepID=UPI0025544645|nr:uncharacterized protein LOC130674495 [Microplitis mediator]
MTPWLVAVFCLVTAGCLNVTDQQTSESQNEQVAILKQLRKVNEDGSYTFGYEAGDGSFKVETRDVLGNVKGTFGFVDGNGEIKRVTYSSSNGTGFKATTVSPLQERPSVVQTIPRTNRSSSTRKPSPTLVYATSTSTESSSTLSTSSTSSTSSTINSKLNVGPTVRSRIKTTPMPSSSTNSTTEAAPKTVFGNYLKSTKRPRSFINSQRSLPSTTSSEQESADNGDEDSQIIRPTVEAKAATQRKNYFTKRPIDHTLRPITEEFDEKDDESKSAVTGNNLRRQLHDETTIKVEESRESSDEHSDVYHSGSLSTPRPLFTTTNNPKIIQRIRMERPKILYHNHNNHHQQVKSSNEENYGPAQFDDSKYQNTRVYEAENKIAEQEREAPEQFVYRVPHSRVPQRDYARTMEPLYIRRQQQILKDLPPNLFVPSPNNDEEDYQPPVERILARLQARAYPRPSEQENVDYIAEAPGQQPMEPVQPQPPPPPVPAPNPANHQNYINPRQFARLVRPYVMDHEARSRGYMRLQPVDEKDYMDGYYRNVVLPPEPPNPIAPPLSRRDFQLLLRRLLVSQYGVQALTHPRTYLDHALYDEQSYPYQRPRLMYEEPIPQPRPRLIPAIDPLYNSYYPEQNPGYQDPRYARRVYRQKFYDQDVNDPDDHNHGDEILPPPVREALLLRMLQLAINNQRSITPNTILMSTTPSSSMTPVTTSGYRKSGPVRSVQIITDDKSEDKDDTRKKL